MTLDFSKYKRFFTFGCSFTEYRFPTWANIMSKMMPDAEFYNFGQSGGGNTLIASRVAETNMKYKFCDTDLIMIMWSTLCREDRWLPSANAWICPGNIYSQKVYEDFTTDAYLKKYGQPITYLIRDLATIEMTRGYLETLPCDSLAMLSTPFDFQQDKNDEVAQSIIAAYKPLIDSFPRNMYDFEMGSNWNSSITYVPNGQKEPISDYHPSPRRYASYLKKIGIPLTKEVEDYANESDRKLLTLVKHEKDLYATFPEESKINWGKLI